MIKTYGIHHVSSIVGHAQKDIDFYAGVLGTRLVKKTLNFDDKEHYHFYYGNHDGSSGLITTFPREDALQGKNGSGHVGYVTYALKPHTFKFWNDRFKTFNIPHYEYTRFGERRLAFTDPHGLELEFIETDLGPENTWSFNGVSTPNAFIGIHSATLYSRFPLLTETLITDLFGYEKIGEDDEISRYKIHDDLGGLLEIHKHRMADARNGSGIVHHIAFKILEEDLEDWRTLLIEKGYNPTEVKNRKYFKSIYFREKGGIIIELATIGPGVLVDESREELGSNFKVPPHFENSFDINQSTLMPITVKEITQLENYGYRDRQEYDLLQTKHQLRERMSAFMNVKKSRPLTPDEETQYLSLQKEYLKVSKGDSTHDNH